MKTFKHEEAPLTPYQSVADLLAASQYLEHTYNHRQLHSALGYLPPGEFEAHHQRLVSAVKFRILQQAVAGTRVRELCRKHGITEQTFYRWRAKYAGLQVSDAKRPPFRRVRGARTLSLLLSNQEGSLQKVCNSIPVLTETPHAIRSLQSACWNPCSHPRTSGFSHEKSHFR